MGRCAQWGMLALGASIVMMPLAPALANCDQLRTDIASMDAKSSRQPGYFQLRAELGSLYAKLCDGSTPARAQEFWYDLNGNNLGVAGGDRPASAAYATTAEIGRICASSGNPGMCALARGAFDMCANPPDADTKAGCKVLGAYPRSDDDPTPGQAAPPLPPVNVTLGGKSFALNPDCVNLLANVADDSPDGRNRPSSGLRYRMIDNNRLEAISGSCPPDMLATLERQLGARAEAEPGRFWPAFTQLAAKTFATPPAAPGTPGGMPLEFCRQAEANMNTCKARWASMGPVDGTSHSRSGQAGAFADCYFLYQKAFGMCRINAGLAALRKPASVAAPTPPAVPKTPPANPPQGSRSPPPPTQSSGPALSPQCQTLVSNYVGAAQAGDGSRAVAGYNALKQAGGCGVLAKVDRPLPAAPAAPAVDDSRFEARGATPLSDQVVGGCDASPDECARRVRQLQAGTSPEAKAALMSHAIGVGLQLGNALGGAVLSAVPTSVPTAGGGVAVPSGGGSNMNSIGNKPVRSTYGQGAPTGVAPPYRPSDITGTK